MDSFDNSPSRRGFLGLAAAVTAGATLTACTRATSVNAHATSVDIGMAADVVPKSLVKDVAVNLPVRALVFDTLVGLDTHTGDYIPKLATSWKWSTDKKSLVMSLRDDVKFHSGRTFGPEDAIFCVKTAQNPDSGSQVAQIADRVTSMRQTGAHEVTFVLSAPLLAFLDLFVLAPVVDSETVGGIASGTKVVGTGPFVWKSWTPGSSVALERNPHYWAAGTPHLQKVNLRVFSQSQSLVAALRSKNIVAAYQMLPRDAKTFAGDSAYKITSTAPQFTDWFVGVNVMKAPFTDVRVRQAVAWSINRDRIASQIFAGYGTASCMPASSSLPGLSVADEKVYGYDPAKARALLAAAGIENPRVTILSNSANQTSAALLDNIVYDLTQVGFKVTPQNVVSATYQSQVQAATVDGMWLGPADQSCYSLATSLLGGAQVRPKNNTSHFSTPQYDKLSSAVINASDTAEQAQASAAFMSYLLEQAFNITVAHGHYMLVSSSELSGADTTGGSELDLTHAR